MSDVNVVLLGIVIVLNLVTLGLGIRIYQLRSKVTELRTVLQKRHQVVSRIKKNTKRAKLAGLCRPKTAAQKTVIRRSKKDKTAKTAVTIKTG